MNVVALLQELLDAHLDTIEMIEDGRPDADWASHAQYLRDVRRQGYAVLVLLESERQLQR
jgi:hypothetical protein